MENQEYFTALLKCMKKMYSVKLADYSFNHSEMRLLDEVMVNKSKGKRVISTQIAKDLDITRSAVSQLVDRLQQAGHVTRVADAVDRKKFYIELTKEAEDLYVKQRDASCATVEKVIEKMGSEKLDQIIALVDEFVSIVNEVK